MSNWTFGNYYPVRVVAGQHIIKTLPNEKRTKVVEVLCEVIDGPMQGQKIRYSGYINTAENAARTLGDLRVMGLTGKKWGDWTGLGVGKKFEVRVLSDEGTNGRIYARAAFPREVLRITATPNVTSDAELEELNEKLPDFDQLGAIAEAQVHDTANPPF